MNSTTIAVDLAKSVFQISIANDRGRILERRRFTRRQFERFLGEAPPSHFVLEACGTAHHWGRLLLSRGHTVSLLPPHYVRPFVARTKTDRSDADALVQAARSGEIPTVAVKSCDQQQMVALHRIRTACMKTRTARINLLRGVLAEQGVPIAAGAQTGLAKISRLIHDDTVELGGLLRQSLQGVLDEIADLECQVAAIELQLKTLAKEDVVQELMTIPGVGLITATALVGSVGDIDGFRRGRQFASWLGEFLPGIPIDGSGDWLATGIVKDPTDGKLVHLDGVNLSRAWNLENIAAALSEDDPRRKSLLAAAGIHAQTGIANVSGEHYEGSHWLASFATYLVTSRAIQ